jgi:hypothetical protein
MSNAINMLERSWNLKGTSIYLTQNWKRIKQYLYQHGASLSRAEIKKFLEAQKTSNILYKNEGIRKLRETSKSFLRRSRYFAMLQGDLLFLSKSRSYGTQKPYILATICILSRYVFIEGCKTKQFVSMEKAMSKIIQRIKMIHPAYSGGDFLTDGGGEFGSELFKSFFRQHNITHRVAARRDYRGSTGAAVVETTNRRIRQQLEKVMVEQTDLSFEEKLKLVEKQLNLEILDCIGMSATEAFNVSPLQILMITQDKHLRKRKYLRQEISSQGLHEIKVGCVVRVKINQEKDLIKKESYGSLSPYFVVISLNKSQQVWTYKIANLLTLYQLNGNYTYNELKVVNISYFSAVRKVENDIKKKIKISGDLAFFRINYLDMILCSNKSVFAT